MDLKDKIIKVVTSDEFILLMKEKFLVKPKKRKYEGYRVEEDGLLLYKD